MMKRCTRCGLTKLVEEFHKNKARKDGLQTYCKPCMAAIPGRQPKDPDYKKKWHNAKDPDYHWARNLWSQFKLTAERYWEMFEAQGGLCANCGKPERVLRNNGEIGVKLCVDHDRRCCPAKRSCGKCIRGLLCHCCNAGLGLLGDTVEDLERAVSYLRRWEADGRLLSPGSNLT